MCLAVPAQVVEIQGDLTATVNLSGVSRQIAIDLVPDAKVGDYVIVHVGFAIQRLDEAEAQQTLSLLEELDSSIRPRDA